MPICHDHQKDAMTHTSASSSGFSPTGQLHFGVNLVGPAASLNFEQLRTLAQTAERGLFSWLTLDERYWLGDDPGSSSRTDPAGSNDVSTLLTALAAVTTNIGLVAAAAPDDDDPEDLVRRIASLDKISGGRAAWNLLADASSYGKNDGGLVAFFAEAQRVWAAWREASPLPKSPPEPAEAIGAFLRDGQLYSVGIGALKQSAPRYRPVIIHGSDSTQDRAFAAREADAITSAPASLTVALDFRRDMVARSLEAGRGANSVKIFQGATFVLAQTQDEAVEKANWIREQLPDCAWDESAFVGSYSGIADLLLDYARSGAVDGFTVMPWLYPSELTDMVNHLVPELQARGIYPADYEATTLRGNLGLTSRGNTAEGQATHTLPIIEVEDLEDIRLDLDLRMELVVQKLQPE